MKEIPHWCSESLYNALLDSGFDTRVLETYPTPTLVIFKKPDRRCDN